MMKGNNEGDDESNRDDGDDDRNSRDRRRGLRRLRSNNHRGNSRSGCI